IFTMPEPETVSQAKPKPHRRSPRKGRPTWEIAYLFPRQGRWTEDEYLELDGILGSRRLLELSNGCLEILPMPTEMHQFIVAFFYEYLKAFTLVHAPGTVFFSGIRVKLKKGKFRLPDVVYMKAENAHRRHNEYWEGADLVMEVVSGGHKDRERGLGDKPDDYARAGIPGYWIIEPEQQAVPRFTLKRETGKAHGE